ncbi:hypothetical protein [Aquabacterium sp. J223]|uniref:hypothetical protein n=1 Tax=Aquabacterium sp. J223 TaxID=2898431 RepID=UPI0021AD568E|nr:hypothetical protein [Aquabacterium sp. J223]UUX94566.1 hypothetical protein LRS07_14800 [Aquabacterium sp. J223]
MDDGISTVSKAAVLAALARAGTPSTLPLVAAQQRCPTLSALRRDAIEQDASLLELSGATLAPLVPEGLAHWPVWYIRLAVSGAHDVSSLVWRESLSPYLDRDEHNPWYIGQWLAIAGWGNADPWDPDSRHLVIDDRDVNRSINTGLMCGGVIVLYECQEHITITGYPIDELLVGSLQAGDGASCRHPLFDLPLTEVQAMTRALEDGEMPAASPSRLRLKVLSDPCGARSSWRLPPETLLQRPSVSVTVHDDGRLGSLLTVGDWWATQVPRDIETVLWLDAPQDMCTEAAASGIGVDVTVPPPSLDEPTCIVLTATCGMHLYAALLNAEDEQTRAAVDALPAGSTCRLVLVNTLNGRPVWAEFQWPELDLAHVSTRCRVEAALPSCPAEVRRRAEAWAERTGRRVELNVSWATAAPGDSPAGA